MNLLQAPPMPFHEMYFLHFQGMADNPLIWAFVWAVIFDIVTGFAKSLISHKVTSNKGTDGLIKHGVLLLISLTLYPLLDANGFKSAGDAFILFYILFYAVSIIENWGQIGLPLPSWVKPYIYKLSDEYKFDPNRKKKGDNKHA